jgi:hypothetical protein
VETRNLLDVFMDGSGDFFIGRKQKDGQIIRLSDFFQDWEKVKKACSLRNVLEAFREETKKEMQKETEARHG